MNILFIGSIYSESFKKILTKSNLPLSSAGQTFQTALLSGLDSICTVKVISEFFVPTYPRFKHSIINSELFSHNELASQDTSISFLNLPGFKKISQLFSYCIKLQKQRQWADVVVVYEATSRQLLAPVLIVKKLPKIVIIPDLPEFMSDNHNPIYLFAKKLDRIIINYALKRFDGFVLLSKFMKEKLNIIHNDYILIEGIIKPQHSREPIVKSNEKIVLYTGKIEKWFGLEDLLKAFCQVKGEDKRLWLCGPGDMELVEKYMEVDSRIEYKGCLSHEEVLEIQKKATILVNPRHSYDAYTLYSFPSKTMEYMASGTPTLMCKLMSIPDEYLKHLYIFEDESIEGFTKKLEECLNLPEDELTRFGKDASEFILNHKNSNIQAYRLVEYIKKIICKTNHK